jgi:cyclin C
MLRQVPIATATIYFKRFYLKNAYCETNPYLVLAACLLVAAKVEETPVHIKSVVSEAKAVFTGTSPLNLIEEVLTDRTRDQDIPS